ncbi:EscU/YscU/HrcU family type III secretion system export apparatus switch protein [Paenibacillus sp. J2TS4]|uniref:EscU/YscU/HrcU family type III secretion system export apparatus switch protein n=1 Tax=Paenibacillus sp. J2TS4 TaxID=2807194 RepID=UPI001B287A91|nr:EscU/YscU/HrcU family type III secretion system export apparatus switch protein [Paenibacillus sp. J2TS4]GIP33040.1 flagellar biosynthetic protein FlhB [Paenibacillus sp. J2TS4]
MNSDRHTTKKAVALRYSPEQTAAPVLVAKGKGEVAEKILNTAKEFGVPVQENASLVEVLSQLDLEQQIPADLYDLVAEILTFVYRSDQRAGQEKGSP